MIIHEPDCVNCPVEMGCLGSSCPYAKAAHYYCDERGNETDIYHFDGKELCLKCIKKLLDPVIDDYS